VNLTYSWHLDDDLEVPRPRRIAEAKRPAAGNRALGSTDLRGANYFSSSALLVIVPSELESL
jgi:hypothetical protein